MARKTTKKAPDRVELIATNRTQGARTGAVARPLAADMDKWLALGWVRVVQPEPDDGYVDG